MDNQLTPEQALDTIIPLQSKIDTIIDQTQPPITLFENQIEIPLKAKAYQCSDVTHTGTRIGFIWTTSKREAVRFYLMSLKMNRNTVQFHVIS